MAKKTHSFILLIAAILLSGLFTLAAAAEGNPAASGHGNIISRGELRTFSFTAVMQTDGTVTGQVEIFNRGFPVRVHQKIDCLKFVGGNRVIASGPVTQSTDPGVVAVGRIGVFGVEDNGEGTNSPPDKITTVPDYAPGTKNCNDFTFVGNNLVDISAPGVVVRPLGEILDGNIQVQP